MSKRKGSGVELRIGGGNASMFRLNGLTWQADSPNVWGVIRRGEKGISGHGESARKQDLSEGGG